MTLPTDYVDGDVLTAADVNAITTAVNGTIPVATIAAKGDLLVGLTNDSVGVLAVGTNGYLLSASSGAASGLAWTAAGGKLLKVGYATFTAASVTTSTSFTDSNITISYTPISASSYLIVEATFAAGWAGNTANIALKYNYYKLRNTTNSTDLDYTEMRYATGAASTDPEGLYGRIVLRSVVASSSTTARTYTVQHHTINANLGSVINSGGTGTSAITVYEVEV